LSAFADLTDSELNALIDATKERSADRTE